MNRIVWLLNSINAQPFRGKLSFSLLFARVGIICLLVASAIWLLPEIQWAHLSSKLDSKKPSATPSPRSRQTVNPVTTVSAASYETSAIAPASIVAAFGGALATSVQIASTIPLPTSLAGTTVKVKDSANVERLSPLFFVAPSQVNYLIPPDTALGTAIVTVQSGDGTISQGSIQVNSVAPALLTANATGDGPPAAKLLRLKPDNSLQYEELAQFDPASGRFVTKPIDLGPEGDRVFLILFLSGVRRAADPNGDGNLNESVHLIIGGIETIPLFVGVQPEFVGVDQINSRELSRDLLGRGRVSISITASGFNSSNIGEIEIAGPANTSPPVITGFSPPGVLAGQTLTINGAGFTPNALVRIAGSEASVISATSGQLTVRVPYGVEGGLVSVQTTQGEGVSASPISIRTSISGFVEDAARQPMNGVTVRLVGTNTSIQTNPEGVFILPDVPAGNAQVEIDASTSPIALSYPKFRLPVNVRSNRDNQFLRPIALQAASNQSIAVGASSLTVDDSEIISVSAPVNGSSEPGAVEQTGNLVLELPTNAVAQFPDGSTTGSLTLTAVTNGRLPVKLPFGHYGSAIAQITPFGAKLNPGGKLTFPNLDGFAAGSQTKLFRFDQTAGGFVEAGMATVSGDGQRIETAAGAITETGYFFVSAVRPTATLIGRVIESDGRAPVRRVIVRARGQETLSDGNGGFILRGVPVNSGDQVLIDASYLRPSGRVERVGRDKVVAGIGGVSSVAPDLELPSATSNRAPAIFAPAALSAIAGQAMDVSVTINDPDPNQTVQLQVSGATFATIRPGTGANNFILRLAPGASEGNNYTLTLSATDSQDASKSQTVSLGVLIPPRIISITPSRARAGETVMINGEGFDDTAPNRNTVRFTRAGGQTVASVTAVTATKLTVTVPPDATTGPISVQNSRGTATSPVNFELGAPPPVITDFNPKNASAGTLVTITGTNLAPAPGSATQVTLSKQGGGTIAAPVGNVASTSLAFTIPTGAASGQIAVAVEGQSTTSSATLNIVASSNFTLAATPASASLIQGQSVSYSVKLDSSNGFTQLASLNVTGVPAGVTAVFTPQQITAAQTAILKLTAPSNQPVNSSPLTINASASVDGLPVTQTANVMLDIKPISTSFLGRTVVADTLETPLAGVTIKFLGKDETGKITGCSGQMVSDAAGNFAFTNLPSSCTGSQLIRYDGLTVTAPAGKYAGVDLIYNIVPNQVTASPVLVHLPRIDNKETVMVKQNAATDQTFTFRSIPNLSVTVYAGTTLTLVDGTKPDPFPFTAVQVPVDRLPDAKPANPTMLNVFIVAFQPANATASQPVPITYPNTINTPPGTNMPLMTLDPTQGKMVPYGTGTVSNDGTQVIPDLDPARPGKRYGLIHFDWHGQMPPPPDPNNPDNPSPDTVCPPGATCSCPVTAGKPIDLSSGIEVISNTDIAISGLRGSIAIVRTYRTLSTFGGPFGIGSNHNYGYRLNTNTPSQQAVINLITPDGNQLPYNRQPNGTLINTTIPSLVGSVMTVKSEGHVEIRWKDGTVYGFTPATFSLGSTLTSITDANGNRVSFLRDIARPVRITQVVDPVGRRLTLSYDDADRITSITDPIGRQVKYTYNAQGALATVTDPEGGITQYDYTTPTRLTRVTDARGVIIAQNTYDSNGRVIEQLRPDGGKIKFAYTLLNPTTEASPILKTVVTDPLGNQTTYRFDPNGFLQNVTDAAGQTQILDRMPGSNFVMARKGSASCASCGVSSAGDESFSYDETGNVLSRTDALGHTTRYAYDPVFNKVASITDPLGNVVRFAYDSKGNLISRTDENGKVTSFKYDANGLLIEITDPLNQRTALGYDGFGNLISVTDPLSNKSSFRYDAIGRQIEAVDALGHRTATAYDKLNRVIEQVNAQNNKASFEYDKVSNVLSIIDQRGKKTSFAYDVMNRLLTRTTPLGKVDRREYDFSGNQTKFVDRRGQASTFTYDALNRLIGESYQDASTVKRFYDTNGRLVRVEDSVGGVFTFTYDLVGNLFNSVNQFGTVRYAYDDLDRVKERQVVGQPSVTHTYDPAGNLLTAAMPQASIAFEYDARNQPTKATRANGVTTTNTYDQLGRVLSIIHAKDNNALHALSYTYDAVGNRTSATTSSGQPLTTQTAIASYDDGNRQMKRGATSYVHDDNGNLILETTTAGVTRYEWDARNRLRSIIVSTGKTISFLYDFAGNLISQRDLTADASLTQSFVLDDLTNIAYQSNSDGKQFSVLRGHAIDQHWAVMQTNGQVEYGLTDAINSTVATVDQGGMIKGQFFYEPFGMTRATGSTYMFQYSGRRAVVEGFYDYRARYYNTQEERFTSEDPIAFGGGDLNYYRYVFNNPINWTDPTGLRVAGAYGIDTCPLKGTHEEQPERYPYGLDLRHYVAASNTAILLQLTFPGPRSSSLLLTNFLGLGVEFVQLLGSNSSAFQSEDVISNALGAIAGSTGIYPVLDPILYRKGPIR